MFFWNFKGIKKGLSILWKAFSEYRIIVFIIQTKEFHYGVASLASSYSLRSSLLVC
jgi:hypothetical protein